MEKVAEEKDVYEGDEKYIKVAPKIVFHALQPLQSLWGFIFKSLKSWENTYRN